MSITTEYSGIESGETTKILCFLVHVITMRLKGKGTYTHAHVCIPIMSNSCDLQSRGCTEFIFLQSILEDRERFRRQESGEGRLDQLTKYIVTSQSGTCGRQRNNV